jgi:small conductance mechanosensitive channel
VTAPRLAVLPFLPDTVLFIIIGAAVFVAFAVVARVVARSTVRALHRRQLRSDQVAFVGRAVTFILIGVGAVVAIGTAFQSANVALAGILLATIVASFGVQDLLKDYVSGYYVLLERHIKVGSHISVEGWSGQVTDIKLRVTMLRNDAGDVVVVPNSELFNRPVTVHAPPVPSEGQTVAAKSEAKGPANSPARSTPQE